MQKISNINTMRPKWYIKFNSQSFVIVGKTIFHIQYVHIEKYVFPC